MKNPRPARDRTGWYLARAAASTGPPETAARPVGEEPFFGSRRRAHGANGDYYGTTNGGGMHSQGSVFQIASGGTLTTLYSFCALSNCADGQGPRSGVVEGGGGFTSLYSFCESGQNTGNCPDGSFPEAGLAVGSSRGLYGTTYNGGAENTCHLGCGTVFLITPPGSLTTLHSFTLADAADENPFSQLASSRLNS